MRKRGQLGRVPGSREGLRMSGRWQEQTEPAGPVSTLNPQEPGSANDEAGGEG